MDSSWGAEADVWSASCCVQLHGGRRVHPLAYPARGASVQPFKTEFKVEADNYQRIGDHAVSTKRMYISRFSNLDKNPPAVVMLSLRTAPSFFEDRVKVHVDRQQGHWRIIASIRT